MLFEFGKKPHVSVYASRRKSLIQGIKDTFDAEGAILLIGGFNKENVSFVQESSFYYFTGIEEPGVALLIDAAGKATLYIPRYAVSRAHGNYENSGHNGYSHGYSIDTSKESATRLGVDSIVWLGDTVQESHVGPFCDFSVYKNLVEQLKMVNSGSSSDIYTLAPTDSHSCVEQRLFLMRLSDMMPFVSGVLTDITSLVADLRSSKDMSEVELIKGAVSVATIAHEAAAHIVGDQIPELDIQAGLEGVVTMAGGHMACPTVIEGGKSGVGKDDINKSGQASDQVIEYTRNGDILSSGQLVTVNIGVMYNYYIANLARTYPVSGTFSKHQRTVYDVLIAAQEYIIDFIQSGYWISNPEVPSKSLFHLLKTFFVRYHYEQYFIQDIGHHIGLELHDMVDTNRPLRTGDVIVLTLGLQIPKDSVSIMIKDIYWVIKKGAINLSEELPTQAEDIELFMKERSQEEEEQEDLFVDDYQESDDLDTFDFSSQDDIEH